MDCGRAANSVVICCEGFIELGDFDIAIVSGEHEASRLVQVAVAPRLLLSLTMSVLVIYALWISDSDAAPVYYK